MMADVFGDLSLFSEFERDREAEGSFIRYDEDSLRSKIVFEGFDSDAGSESDVEPDEKPSDSGGDDQPLDNKGDAISVHQNGKSTQKSNKASDETMKDQAWLTEQLYAQAEEEAKGSNVNLNQLMFEKIKFEQFCKLVDSTRYVPDDDSPPVQLLFHNTSFARKYRQQIEQFIKGLLWEYLHNPNVEPVKEISARPGAPSSVDVNSKLGLSERNERMRQKHALIGSCQFHNKFLVDILGWPFSLDEPIRCNENWEIPLYSQLFDEVYADPSLKGKSQQKKRLKPACWNCGTENHSVAECRHPRNPARIAANRKEFLETQAKNHSENEPKFTGAKRYHLDPEISSKFAKYQAGQISDSLRQALGLKEDQLPQHIYKMRLFGYPPGWLAEAKPVQSNVTIFDKNGRVTLITGECLEDGELDEEEKEPSTEYNINKIVEYPGFTVPVPLGFVDEHTVYKMPPIQQHQLKQTLMKQSGEKAPRKRKRDSTKDEKKAKQAKTSLEEGEEGEIEENEDKEEKTEEEDESKAAESNEVPEMNRSSSTISLSRDFGTPILVREKSDLPDASKFSVGVEDHIPFENLPDATGTFEKMKDLIDLIRKKRLESS